MGNGGYEHHNHNHHETIFLPILCRLSIKDINLNNQNKIPKPSSDEPSSPKVSCIGQVKRNNRVIAYPAAATTAIAAVNHHKKYTKLQKLFSNKTLLPNTTRNGSKSCRTITTTASSVNNSRKLIKAKNDCAKMVNIDEMDPPLPVVKRVAPPGVGRDEVNIWKRRFNGEGLKSLQIEQIHLPNTKFQPPTTV